MSLYHIEKGVCLLSLLSKEQEKNYFCAKVNGMIQELTYVFKKSGDYEIEFLDLTDSEAVRMYSASMRYIVSMACKMIYPKMEIRFFYNISRTIFAKVVEPKNCFVDPHFVEMLKNKVDELIQADIPFARVKVEKKEAVEIYKKLGFKDKINVLKYRKEDYVHLCQTSYSGFKYSDYMYSKLVPSSGYLKRYRLKYYAPGFVIQVPRCELNGEIPQFVNESKFAEALQCSSQWEEMNQLDTVSNINKFIKNYSSLALINVSESRINDMLSKLGDEIVDSSIPIRLICVAGPSSSGKTSFANRLTFELMSRGLRPVRISMDDYYLPDDRLDSSVSYESVDALDIDLFNLQMDELIRGKKVHLPLFDFKDRKRKEGEEIKLALDQPIIVEGIHALNKVVCSNIPDTSKYKIYIAPQPQVNIDNHTPISMTDMRLLRRIARDARTRNTDALKTIKMWPSVRQGEFDYIYSTQENADFVFDSFLPYEICAIRDIVLPLLDKITPDCEGYLMAHRLKNMVRYFTPISLEDIPCNSLVREFVGGSSFKDAR